jgi:hypothetical protein
MGAFNYVLSELLKDTKEEMNLSQETLEELRKVNYIGLTQANTYETIAYEVGQIANVSNEFMDTMVREKKYKAALDHWKSYQNWKKNRNPKRAAMEAKCGLDSKHASHLVRLGKMAKEIMTGQGVIVKRPDREYLLDIKQGNVPYEEIVDFAENLDKEMNELYKTSTLPKEPNRKKIDELCIQILEKEFLK